MILHVLNGVLQKLNSLSLLKWPEAKIYIYEGVLNTQVTHSPLKCNFPTVYYHYLTY